MKPSLSRTTNPRLSADEDRRQANPLSPGEKVGPYDICREIGRGGMGVVYLAYDEALDRPVALKVAYSKVGDLEATGRTLLEEARSAARLDHPGVVKIFTTGVHADRPFVAMEYAPGKSLSHILETRGPLSEAKALEIVRQAAHALASAHAAGLVHRDIKPANIQLTESGLVKVMDFGIASRVGDAGLGRDCHCFVGTPEYASPEQAALRDLDGRSDLFSLGVVLFEMLTGDLPFHGDTAASLLKARCLYQPALAARIDRAASKPVAALLHKMLAVRPLARYQSADELLDDLDTLLGARRVDVAESAPPGACPVSAESTTAILPADGPEHGTGRRRSSVVRLLLSGVLAGLLAGVAAGFAVFHDDTAPRSEPRTAPEDALLSRRSGEGPGLAVSFRFTPLSAGLPRGPGAARLSEALHRGLDRGLPWPVRVVEGEEEACLADVEVRARVVSGLLWMGAVVRDENGRLVHVSCASAPPAELADLCDRISAEIAEALLRHVHDRLTAPHGLSATLSL